MDPTDPNVIPASRPELHRAARLVGLVGMAVTTGPAPQDALPDDVGPSDDDAQVYPGQPDDDAGHPVERDTFDDAQRSAVVGIVRSSATAVLGVIVIVAGCEWASPGLATFGVAVLFTALAMVAIRLSGLQQLRRCRRHAAEDVADAGRLQAA